MSWPVEGVESPGVCESGLLNWPIPFESAEPVAPPACAVANVMAGCSVRSARSYRVKEVWEGQPYRRSKSIVRWRRCASRPTDLNLHIRRIQCKCQAERMDRMRAHWKSCFAGRKNLRCQAPVHGG